MKRKKRATEILTLEQLAAGSAKLKAKITELRNKEHLWRPPRRPRLSQVRVTTEMDHLKGTIENLQGEKEALRLKLKAEIDDLKGTNQQLVATNQHLVNTNKHLEATNEELVATNQQLKANNVQLLIKPEIQRQQPTTSAEAP